MYDPKSGQMLELDPVRGVAHCPVTGYHKSLEGEQRSHVCSKCSTVLETGAVCNCKLELVTRPIAADVQCPKPPTPQQLQRPNHTTTELSSIRLASATNMAEYRRQFNLEPLVKDETELQESARVRATVDEKCPQCGHEGMEFYTMQLRSADEGQTVFYECPDCKYKYSQNN